MPYYSSHGQESFVSSDIISLLWTFVYLRLQQDAGLLGVRNCILLISVSRSTVKAGSLSCTDECVCSHDSWTRAGNENDPSFWHGNPHLNLRGEDLKWGFGLKVLVRFQKGRSLSVCVCVCLQIVSWDLCWRYSGKYACKVKPVLNARLKHFITLCATGNAKCYLNL